MDLVPIYEELKIDESFLNEEIMKQPGLYLKYSTKAVEQQKKVLLAEIHLKQREAELAQQFREENAHNKVTEGRVKEYLLNHPELIKMREELAEMKAELDQLNAIRNAFFQRATMLELLVRLNSQ